MIDFLQHALLFVVVLSVLVAFHEYGHFIVARVCGVKVLRFSIGFGKPLLKYQRHADGTEFAIAGIPLGGYVKMLDGREMTLAENDKPYAFDCQPTWKKIAIVAAGPVFNLILAVVFFSTVFMLGVQGVKPVLLLPLPDTPAYQSGITDKDEVWAVDGVPVDSWSSFSTELVTAALDKKSVSLLIKKASGEESRVVLDIPNNVFEHAGSPLEQLGLSPWAPMMTIGHVTTQSPAEKAGLRAGDVITKINQTPVRQFNDLVSAIKTYSNQPLRMEFMRGGLAQTVTVIPRQLVSEQGVSFFGIGVSPKRYTKDNNPYLPYLKTIQRPFFSAFQGGIESAWNHTILTFRFIGKLLIGQASVKNLSGPVSIAQFASQSASIGWVYLLEFMAVISVSLGVLNLLPIPVLDGGHIVIHLIEGIKKSPIPEQVLGVTQLAGLVILVGIMSLAFYNDIIRVLG